MSAYIYPGIGPISIDEEETKYKTFQGLVCTATYHSRYESKSDRQQCKRGLKVPIVCNPEHDLRRRSTVIRRTAAAL